MTFRDASTKYGIPIGTLGYRKEHFNAVKGNYFAPEEEELILEFIEERQKGATLSKSELLSILNNEYLPVNLIFLLSYLYVF